MARRHVHTPSEPADGANAQASATPQRPRQGLARFRRFLPIALVLVWVTLGGLGGPLFGRISEVSSNDPTAYLPSSAEATEVQARLGEFLGEDAIPAIILFVGEQPLSGDQLTALTDLTAGLSDTIPAVGESSPPIPSEDGLAAQTFVPIDADADLGESVEALRATVSAGLPDGVTVYVTGPAGLSGDLVEAFAGIDGLLLFAALGAVLVILVIVYRSPILPVFVLVTSVFALCGALLTVFYLAKAGVFLLSGQTQGILFILVIGAATDYGLLYVARFREELRRHASRWDATRAAIRGSLEPILASGGTVIAGLMCLLLSDLESNRTLGPIASVGIVFAMLAAFTLLPALLLLAGRTAFWPRRPTLLAPELVNDPDVLLPTKGIWHRVPAFVARKPRTVWITTTLVLLAMCVGVTQLKADGVPQSDLVLGASEARDGQVALGEHFPGGSGSPTYVLAPEATLQETADALLANDGVSSVAVTAKESPSGSAPVTAEGIGAVGPPGTAAPAPTVAAGDVLLQATLVDASDSNAAAETVRDLRATFGDDVLIGGTTATAIDSNDASVHDRNLIIPVVLIVILLILGLLLRAIIAPIMLIATVVLSYFAALGVSAIVFNEILGLPGADPAVPLYAFVFLVALGIDYNIFLMTRVREETIAHGTRQGLTRGLSITGGVITSAGLVLAATFAALAVIPILFLLQLAFIVAFGVLLDTIVVRTLLVPALSHHVGDPIWWPSRLARRGQDVTVSARD